MAELGFLLRQAYMIVILKLLLLFIMAYCFQKEGSLKDHDPPSPPFELMSKLSSILLFIYLFILAVPGLSCFMWTLSCGMQTS